MNYWWVNQNQTHKHEISGGYMWSPKNKRDGSKNTFYDNMTKVKPGDIVFSFYGAQISYLGVITSYGYSSPKPDFGTAGNAWDRDGWMVNVDYRTVKNKIRPRDYIEQIRPYLPSKYSPLQKSGDGNQGVYLAHIPENLANTLLELIDEDADLIIVEWGHEKEGISAPEIEEESVESLIRSDPTVADTEKEVIIKARQGQGKFRDNVIALHNRCPFTGIDNPKFLRAGHLKPWSKCDSNQERINPLNGLPLTPVVDMLIDQGLVSFDEYGNAIFSPELNPDELRSMGIDPGGAYSINIINDDHRRYISYHRTNVFKQKNQFN